MIHKKKTYMLGEELLRRGLVHLEEIDRALEVQKQSGEFIGEILVRFGFVSESKLIEILADQFELRLVNPAELSLTKDILERVPAKVAQHYHVLPIDFANDRTVLVMSKPPEFEELEELTAILGSSIQIVLAERSKIEESIKKNYGVGATVVEKLTRKYKETEKILESINNVSIEETEATAGETSVRELVNQLIIDAQKKRASDIHIEPFQNRLRIRYRIDGILEEARAPDAIKTFQGNIISRIKIMSNLDISEQRLPQDGRIKVRIQNEELDLRISLLPTAFGESLVIRILSPARLLSLDRIGLSPEHIKSLREILKKPSGIILLTGPTGSGKTTTLYACLGELNGVDRKIITVEDPVEYQLEGVIQMQVYQKIGLTFAKGLRHMLRHDPDVMMIGEIRDNETAEIAVRSSMTGHLVFSTMHTNDSTGAIARLVDLGIAPYLASSCLECIIAQRLIRIICEKCKIKKGTQFIGTGCQICNNTGFYGRSAVHEFLLLDDELRDSITEKTSVTELRNQAKKKGLVTLKEDGLAKVKAGLTTESEVLRVI